MSLIPTTAIDREGILRAFNINPRDPKAQAMILACEKYGLDPLLKHAVLISGNLYVTRDGLLHVAHQTDRLDGIVVEDEWETDGEWRAKVTVYVKGQTHGYTYTGRYPKNGQQKKYGPEMAVKVAEVMALRRAFGVTGIPTLEEQWDKSDKNAGESGYPPPGSPAPGGAPAGALPSGSAGGESGSSARPEPAPTSSHTQHTSSAGAPEAGTASEGSAASPEEGGPGRTSSRGTSSHTHGPQAGTTADDGDPLPPPAVGVDGGGVETPAHGDSPAPVVSATTLLIATGKTAGAAVVALKNAAATLSPTGPFMADEIAADPAFAAKVLAHLGGMPADGTTPKATYTQKQNGWIHAVWAKHGGDDARKAYLSRLTSGRTDSSSELTEAERKAYIDKTEELS